MLPKLPLVHQSSMDALEMSQTGMYLLLDTWVAKYFTNPGVTNSIVLIFMAFLLLVIIKGPKNFGCADNKYQSLVLLLVHGLGSCFRHMPNFHKGALRLPRQDASYPRCYCLTSLGQEARSHVNGSIKNSLMKENLIEVFKESTKRSWSSQRLQKNEANTTLSKGRKCCIGAQWELDHGGGPAARAAERHSTKCMMKAGDRG